MTTCIIINPKAGSAGDVDSLRAMLEVLGESHIELTCSPEHAQECAAQAVDQGFRRVVAAGGDGTVNRVLNGLAEARGADGLREVELGVLPLGTGNDLTYSIGMNLPLHEAIGALSIWEARPVDLVQIEAENEGGGRVRRLFFNASAGGFVKGVGESTDSALKRTPLGALSYAITAAASLDQIEECHLMVTVDGEMLGHHAMAAIVSNGRTIGGGIEIAPDAKLDDGLIDVMVIPAAPLSDLLMAGIEAVTGAVGIGKKGVIEHRCGREIRLECEPGMPLSADGEAVGRTPGMYTVIPKGIRVVHGGGG